MIIKENLKIRLNRRKESPFVLRFRHNQLTSISFLLDLLFSGTERFPVFVVPPLDAYVRKRVVKLCLE